MSLFIANNFTSHSGLTLSWKIECDTLTDEDIETLAGLIARKIKFHKVYGVPRGGTKLASKLEKYRRPENSDGGNLQHLIVDDVLTTGRSMEQAREFLKAKHHHDEFIGVVIFNRSARSVPIPPWIKPIFNISGYFSEEGKEKKEGEL